MKDETKSKSPAVEILAMMEARRTLGSWERASTKRKKMEKLVN
jgi:hypothetical protein